MIYRARLKAFLKNATLSKQFIDFRRENTIRKIRETIDRRVKLLSETDPIPLFAHIEIETINRCNGTCEFCPVNRNADTREYKKMDEALLDKIIGELEAINYSGRISLFSNNEPFLDERMVGFIKKTRLALPNAYHYIFTNASVLTVQMFKEVIDNLDYMCIDNYSNDLKISKNIKAIGDYCSKHPADKKVELSLIKTNAIRNTRGGESPNNKSKITYPTLCLLPYRQLVIRPDGKVSLCCQDALGKHTLGDASKNTLKEIWYSEEYRNIRDKINNGRENIDLCKYCDFFTDR